MAPCKTFEFALAIFIAIVHIVKCAEIVNNPKVVATVELPQSSIVQNPDGPPAEKNKDSSVLRFTNVLDGQVMTVDGDLPVAGANITARSWNRSDTQKWMLVRRGDVYLILPQRQHKEWTNFLRRSSKRGSDSLPAVTVVVGIDVMNGKLTQQVLHGRSNQHWEFRDGKEGRILIASPARGKCIQSKQLVKESPSLFQRTKDRIKGVFGSSTKVEIVVEPTELVAVDCEETDLSQLWKVEPISY